MPASGSLIHLSIVVSCRQIRSSVPSVEAPSITMYSTRSRRWRATLAIARSMISASFLTTVTTLISGRTLACPPCENCRLPSSAVPGVVGSDMEHPAIDCHRGSDALVPRKLADPRMAGFDQPGSERFVESDAFHRITHGVAVGGIEKHGRITHDFGNGTVGGA